MTFGNNMKKKSAVILFISTILLSAVVTIGCAYYFDKLSPVKFIDTATFVAVGIIAIGFTARRGASMEDDDPMIQDSMRSLSHDTDAYDQATADDVSSGAAFGWVVISAGIAWGIISFSVYQIFGG